MGDAVIDCARRLEPLPYHAEIAAYLREAEPEIWRWACSPEVRSAHAQEMRDAVLRQTYRLEPDSHPEVHAAARLAMERLDLIAPMSLYQAGDGAMNASLCYIPGEIHLVFFGPILERLRGDELLALLGHELAHYRLWNVDEGAHHAASRIMDHCLSYPGAAFSHRETARLLSLHTELYADRGSALVAGAVAPAVAVLVKTMTGIASVDPAAYLRQAEEVAGASGKSEGSTHPEVFVRAQALARWWQGAPDHDDWVTDKLHGPLSLGALDLLGQRRLTGVTRAFLADFLGPLRATSEAATAQARRLFADLWQQDESALDPTAIAQETIDDATRDYLIALLFDCAMAEPEPDVRAELLATAAARAHRFGAGDRFALALKRDLKWTKAAADRLVARTAVTT